LVGIDEMDHFVDSEKDLQGWAAYRGSWGEDNRMHLGTALLKFGLQRGPGDSFPPVLVKRRKAAVKLGPLRRRQGKVVVFQAIPKLRDQRKALRRGQTPKLVMGE
jgi:hypothetical protein